MRPPGGNPSTRRLPSCYPTPSTKEAEILAPDEKVSCCFLHPPGNSFPKSFPSMQFFCPTCFGPSATPSSQTSVQIFATLVPEVSLVIGFGWSNSSLHGLTKTSECLLSHKCFVSTGNAIQGRTKRAIFKNFQPGLLRFVFNNARPTCDSRLVSVVNAELPRTRRRAARDRVEMFDPLFSGTHKRPPVLTRHRCACQAD